MHFSTFSNDSLAILISWLCPESGWRNMITAYSVYSQLPSVLGGLPSIRNLRTRHAVVTWDPSNMARLAQTMKRTSSPHQNRLWCSPSFLPNAYHGLFSWFKAAGEWSWLLTSVFSPG
jgi:hypothetical protein